MGRKSFLDPDFPFSPKRFPFYYGLFLLGVAIVFALSTTPGQTTGVGPFIDHLIESTGLKRISISYAYMIGTICSAFMIPQGGKILDAYGHRRTAFFSSLGLAGILLVLSQCDRIARVISQTFPLLSYHKAVFGVLALSFALLRFSAQGMMSMTAQTTAGKWFSRHRGKAVGIMSFVMTLAGFSLAYSLDTLITHFGWRQSWIMLAAITGIFVSTFGWLFFRDSPESCGLLPDGAKEDTPEAAAIIDEVSWTRSEAMRTRAFWTLSITMFLGGLILTAVFFHIMDIGSSIGLSVAQTKHFYIVFMITSLVVGPVGGLLADKVNHRYIFIAHGVFFSTSLIMLGLAHSHAQFLASTILCATAMGLSGPLGTAIPKYYGRKHYGAINGMIWAGLVAGSACGPAAFAQIKDLSGSYTTAFLAGSAVMFAIMV